MNGAESLVRTLVGGGVEVCFANPGTSEMHFVAALDRVDGMRCVLGLFEGVVHSLPFHELEDHLNGCGVSCAQQDGPFSARSGCERTAGLP